MNTGYRTTPPPLPSERRKPVDYGTKILLMGLMCFVLMIGTLAIWYMSYSREVRNQEVTEGIVNRWGRDVYIEGPVAKEKLYNADGLRPGVFDCRAEVNSRLLHRSIYEAEVFTAKVNISASFERDSLLLLGDTVVFELGIPIMQIVKLSPLKISGNPIPWRKAIDTLVANVAIADLPETVEYSTDFEIRGSEALYIKPIGEHSVVTIDGEASNPSFDGYSLPVERTQSGEGWFSARWEDSVPDEIDTSYKRGCVGAEFLVGVDRYQKVDRSLKYSFIIIILTFISVLFVEIMRKQPIPLFNYFLIGTALIIFYSLLLSFVELIPFGYAYLIASAMTVILITGYIWKMLKSRRLGISIGVVLSLIYLFCYVMLCISTYALLFGSLLLFFSLAAMMYASLRLNRQDLKS